MIPCSKSLSSFVCNAVVPVRSHYILKTIHPFILIPDGKYQLYGRGADRMRFYSQGLTFHSCFQLHPSFQSKEKRNSLALCHANSLPDFFQNYNRILWLLRLTKSLTLQLSPLPSASGIFQPAFLSCLFISFSFKQESYFSTNAAGLITMQPPVTISHEAQTRIPMISILTTVWEF